MIEDASTFLIKGQIFSILLSAGFAKAILFSNINIINELCKAPVFWNIAKVNMNHRWRRPNFKLKKKILNSAVACNQLKTDEVVDLATLLRYNDYFQTCFTWFKFEQSNKYYPMKNILNDQKCKRQFLNYLNWKYLM